jgi:hypothetical protein
MSNQLSSDRLFKVWEYQVSHGQLLVRSPKAPASPSSPEQVSNLDFVFVGVEYMALPRLLRGIELVAATADELDSLTSILGHSVATENVFVLRSDQQRFPVVAANVAVRENNWDIFESPFKFRSHFHAVVSSTPDSESS